jgi:hypothetical protein
MKRFITTSLALLLTAVAGLSLADSLELADGTLLEGDFVGASNGIIMFNTGETIEAFPESEVVGVFLSAGVETAAAATAAPANEVFVVPAGTRVVIRMADTVDSKKHGAGHKFRGQLEGALVVNGQTMAPRGTMAYGVVVESKKSRRLAGSAELILTFTDLMIDDRLYPISTAALGAVSDNEAQNTVGKTARAAALGGLIDGSSGAKTGAKVGLGASILTSGASLYVPSGTLLETELVEPLEL